MEDRLLKFSHDWEFPKKAGVYMLKNYKNGRVYIGVTQNIRARIASHRSLLLCERHYNDELQRAFDNDSLIANVIALTPHANQQMLRDAERLMIQVAPHFFPAGLINKKLVNYSMKNNAADDSVS